MEKTERLDPVFQRTVTRLEIDPRPGEQDRTDGIIPGTSSNLNFRCEYVVLVWPGT